MKRRRTSLGQRSSPAGGAGAGGGGDDDEESDGDGDGDCDPEDDDEDDTLEAASADEKDEGDGQRSGPMGGGDDDEKIGSIGGDGADEIRARVYGQDAIAESIECALRYQLHVMFSGERSGIGKTMLLDRHCERLVCTPAAERWAAAKLSQSRHARGASGTATGTATVATKEAVQRHLMATFCLELDARGQSIEGVTQLVQPFSVLRYADEPRDQVRVVRVRVANRLSRVFQEALRRVMEVPRLVFAFEAASVGSVEPPFNSRVLILALRPLAPSAVRQLLGDAAERIDRRTARRAASLAARLRNLDRRRGSGGKSRAALVAPASASSAPSLAAAATPRSPSSLSLTSRSLSPAVARPSLIRPMRLGPPISSSTSTSQPELPQPELPQPSQQPSPSPPRRSTATGDGGVGTAKPEVASLREALQRRPRFFDEIVAYADGDARVALRTLELAARIGVAHVAHLFAIHNPRSRAANRILDTCFGAGPWADVPLDARTDSALAQVAAYDRNGWTALEFVECASERLRTTMSAVAPGAPPCVSPRAPAEAPLALEILHLVSRCQQNLLAASCPGSQLQLYGLVAALLALAAPRSPVGTGAPTVSTPPPPPARRHLSPARRHRSTTTSATAHRAPTSASVPTLYSSSPPVFVASRSSPSSSLVRRPATASDSASASASASTRVLAPRNALSSAASSSSSPSFSSSSSSSSSLRPPSQSQSPRPPSFAAPSPVPRNEARPRSSPPPPSSDRSRFRLLR